MKVPLAILLFFIFSGLAGAVTLNPSGSNDQNAINNAIETVSESGGGTVYLNAGVYDIANTVTMRSNIKLAGDPNAIFKVSASSQWFTGQIGVISNPDESLHDVEICNFQINGNIANLPRAWDSTLGHDRDCEKLILIGGWSSSMGRNISIHDMKLYNAFSDGIYIRFTEGVYVYNNFISNCQHEGYYLSCCKDGIVKNNQIAGITSDCGRLDNSQNFKISDNVFFSYDGDSYGAYKHGENGLQVGDQGSTVDHGFAPTAKPLKTQNIEVCNNTFANNGLKAILLDNVELAEQANVYVHDNQFIGKEQLETMGISVDNIAGNVSYEHPPSVKQSERVFNSIFDILNTKFSETATDGGNSYTPNIKKETKGKISAGVDIVGFRNMIELNGKYYIKSYNDVIAVSEVNNLASLPISTDKEISLSEEDNNITADLKVTIHYNTASSYQGKINGIPVTKIKYIEHSETEHFFTSVEAPTIYNISAAPSVNVTILNNSYNPQSRFYVPATPWTTKISFEFNNSTSWHFLKIGEVKNTSKNAEYVSLKDSEYWNKSDDIGNIHDIFVIPKALDPYKADQVKVTLYDCYGNVQNITDYKITDYNEDLTKFVNPFAYLFFGLIFILLYGIYTIFKEVIFKCRRYSGR